MEYFAAILGVGFLAALGVWELLAIAVLFIWLVAGTAYDRTSNKSTAMWLAVVVAVATSVAFSGWQNALTFVLNGEFWGSLALYLGIGLVYAWAAEFLLGVRRAERSIRERWELFIPMRPTLQRVLKNPAMLASTADADVDAVAEAKDAVRSFLRDVNWGTRMVGLEAGDDLKINVKLNRRVLVDNISAWTLLWPAYAISLLIGDLFKQVIEFIVDVAVKYSGALIRRMFANTFSV